MGLRHVCGRQSEHVSLLYAFGVGHGFTNTLSSAMYYAKAGREAHPEDQYIVRLYVRDYAAFKQMEKVRGSMSSSRPTFINPYGLPPFRSGSQMRGHGKSMPCNRPRPKPPVLNSSSTTRSWINSTSPSRTSSLPSTVASRG
jgi:hypothetical protein